MLKILILGDVIGDPGRKAVETFVHQMKETGEIDCAIINAENAAAGAGITETIAKEMFRQGADVITLGDHTFDKKKEIEGYLAKTPLIIRPVNYPRGVPGKGSCIVECKGTQIGVINVMGQVFMRNQFSSPFEALDIEIAKLNKEGVKVIIVDLHAEATSEKMAVSWYVDGRVSAVVGTHTHVPTADERVTEKGTACLTDLGMTGPYDSVIGFDKEVILKKFLTQIHSRHEVAKNDVRLSGAIVTVDPYSGKAISITRIQKKL